MSEEVLCYSLEEAQERTVKAIAAHATDQNVSISIQKLGGYRLLAIRDTQPEPTSP